jgi:hypothetical protein
VSGIFTVSNVVNIIAGKVTFNQKKNQVVPKIHGYSQPSAQGGKHLAARCLVQLRTCAAEIPVPELLQGWFNLQSIESDPEVTISSPE